MHPFFLQLYLLGWSETERLRREDLKPPSFSFLAQDGELGVDGEEEGSEHLSEDGTSPRELDPFQRSLLLPKLLAGANSSHSEVNLVYSGIEDSNWNIWNNVDFLETKNVDICTFSFNRIVPRK